MPRLLDQAGGPRLGLLDLLRGLRLGLLHGLPRLGLGRVDQLGPLALALVAIALDLALALLELALARIRCSASIRTAWPLGSTPLCPAAWRTRSWTWSWVMWRRKASKASPTLSRSYPSLTLGRSSTRGSEVSAGVCCARSCPSGGIACLSPSDSTCVE